MRDMLKKTPGGDIDMGLGMDMSRDEQLEDRAAFMAGEIGGAVVE